MFVKILTMKKIFILKGVSETGKTTKINTIANWIITNYKIPNTIGLDSLNFKKDSNGILTINKLNIGINSAGDNIGEIKKIDVFAPNVDIIVCACRTKGATYQHLYKNYTRPNGWLAVYINVDEFPKLDLVNQKIRDNRIIDELQTWLIGLEK